jgi:porphobilinogen synthase
MAFPINRPRRLRRTATLRRMVRETRLSPDDFIQPYFVCPGRGVKKPVNAMPGVAQMSVDNVVAAARETLAAGVPAVILFGIPAHKDAIGTEAWNDNGEVQRAIREIKEAAPGLVVITDVCSARSAFACAGRSGYRRAIRHDGRARRRDSYCPQ